MLGLYLYNRIMGKKSGNILTMLDKFNMAKGIAKL